MKIEQDDLLKIAHENLCRMEKSPPRKRARYDSETEYNSVEKWSLQRKDVNLDEIFDYGVAHLGAESDALTEGKQWDFTNSSSVDVSCSSVDMTEEDRLKEIALLESTLPKETLQKISNGDWHNLLIREPNRSITDDTNYFESLSDEVILHIFHWLPKRFLTDTSLVCKRWHRLSQDESLWSRMDVSNRNLPPGAIGHILSRQVLILRLAQSEIAFPPILSGVKAALSDFRARLLYLDLSMAHISTESLVMLFSRCYRLKKLSLEHVQVDDDVMLALSLNTDLEILNLAMVEGLQLDGLKYLLSSCQKLRELNIAWTYLDSPCITYICCNLCSSLDRLNFSGCRKLLNDENVMDLVVNCPRLRELDLSDCTGITGEAVKHIVRLEDLNFLALSRCYLIPYRALLQLKLMTSLQFLDVHGGYIDAKELEVVQNALGPHVTINKFKFSSVARPTVGPKRSSIWGMKVRG
ncbi:S-phase kinase-associated protein 2 [Agrilus planipennis]|uniref:S-phase kinase-associated protein 2 n=1 Tax=Agrilus planipennis TaxID=224129 RepID=A0A1W4XS72_AGRPL|nr:S-phase kinase-associated protein 2 [Agrilus planipennis]XP_018335641.1 S-phase kinase-associated protein 2 [Agrilus planipennis]XP_018335642.1 S-phase kinase-associated protein 2 [Agrilus planipennis]